MNREQAKEMLRAYRSNQGDAEDPLFAEALAQAKSDPELKEWFQEELRLDAAISRKLKESAAPTDLVAQIHRGMERRRLSRRRQFLALAACATLLGIPAGVSFIRRKSDGQFATYRKDMTEFLEQFPLLDVELERWPDIQQWLERNHTLSSVELPRLLGQFPGIGCRTVEWRGKRLALVCFMVDGEPVHLFILHRSEFPDAHFPSFPEFATVGRMATAAWETGEVAYLAITKGSEAFLRKHL